MPSHPYPTGFFEQLDRINHEVRLLSLHPGPPSTNLQCTLFRKSLFQLPEFVALSYCWGNRTDTVDIIVNNWPIQVTQNLSNALSQLRKLGIRRVWVDALCISQEDDQEKSDQIRHITQIYSRAYATYAWLGVSNDGKVAAAIGFLQKVAADPGIFPKVERLPNRKDACLTFMKRFRRRKTFNTTSEAELGTIPHESNRDTTLTAGFQSLVDLLACEYWRRRWIVQEIAVSKQVWVCCEDEVINFQAMDTVLKSCRSTPNWNRMHNTVAKYLDQLILFRAQVGMAHRNSLWNTIILTHNFHSERTHDQIFALLGICSDGMELIPVPSYAQSIEAIVESIAKTMVLKQMSFDLLLSDDRDRTASSNYPTWVPNLLSPRVTVRLSSKPASISPYVMQAFSGQPGELTLHGAVLGTIVSLTSTFGSIEAQKDSPQPKTTKTASTHNAAQYYGRSSVEITYAIVDCLLAQHPSSRDWITSRRKNVLLSLLLYIQQYKNPHSRHVGPISDIRGASATAFDYWLQSNMDFDINGIAPKDRINENCLSYVHRPFWRLIIMTLAFISLNLFIRLDVLALNFAHGSLNAIAIFLIFLASSGLLMSIPTTIYMMKLEIDYRMRRQSIFEAADTATHNPHRIAVCDNGMISSVCPEAAVGDTICFVSGFTTAIVLRQHHDTGVGESQPRYCLLGKAFPSLNDDDVEKFAPPQDYGFLGNASPVYMYNLKRDGIKKFAPPEDWAHEKFIVV